MRHALCALVATIALALVPVTVLRAADQSTTAPAGPAFRVTHHDLSAEVMPSTRSLSVTAAVTVRARAAGPLAIRLYLHDEFTVRQVTEQGRPLVFARPPAGDDRPQFSLSASPLDVTLGRDVRENEDVTFTVTYDGPVSKVVNDVNLISPEVTELAGYAAWFPIEKSSGSFTYLLRLTLPAGHVAVTDGRTVETQTAGTATRYVFRRDQPEFDIPIVAGPSLKVLERRDGALSVRVVFRDLDDAAARVSLDGVIRCVALMRQVLGEPASAGTITVVFSPRNGWGYSRVPLMVMSEQIARRQLATESGRLEKFMGVAHEAAHFWWNVATTSTSEDWINESLAEYFSLRTAEETFGAAAVIPTWRGHAWSAAGLPPAKSIAGTLRTDGDAYTLFYRKGSAIFRTLESAMGRPALDQALSGFYRQFRGRRDATTPDLVAAFRGVAGTRYEAFFDRYLRRGGLPEVRVDWAGHGLSVSGTVALDDPALAGFPVTLAFKGDGQAVRRTVTLQPGTTAWRFDLPFTPRSVSTDPDATLLRADGAALIAGKLRPLVHGPGTTFEPELVPTANIAKARAVLDRWEAAGASGAYYEYERGWLALLEARASQAVLHCQAAIARQEELPAAAAPLAVVYRNLGLAYDLLGRRPEALQAYRTAFSAGGGVGGGKELVLALIQNYLHVPYPGGKSVPYAASLGRLDEVIGLVTADRALVNAKDDVFNLPPILWAVRQQVQPDVVLWLALHGADLTVTDENGRSLVEILTAKQHPELAALLAGGANREALERAAAGLMADKNAYFTSTLTPLVHGPDMDFQPELVPAANIARARRVLDRWKAEGGGGPTVEWELGWLALLERRPQEAVERYAAALALKHELVKPDFRIVVGFRNLGCAYDLLGRRDAALQAYRDGIRAAGEFGKPKQVLLSLFQNYLHAPFPRGKSAAQAARVGRLDDLIELVTADPSLMNAPDDFVGVPPVIWAVRDRLQRPALEWLIDHGAALDVSDETGRSLLDIVRSKGAADLADRLAARMSAPGR